MAMTSEMSTAELIGEGFGVGMMQLPEEISELVDRVRALRPNNVLEIGGFRGGTFYLWCQLARGLKISVDLPNGNFGANDYMDTEALTERTLQFQSWAPNVHVILGDSHANEVQSQVRALLGTELLDLLFIDGDHSSSGAAQDWNDYRPLVRPGGLIALHDIRDSEYHRVNGCFVHDFWRTLDIPKAEIIDPFGYWGGIGMVTV